MELQALRKALQDELDNLDLGDQLQNQFKELKESVKQDINHGLIEKFTTFIRDYEEQILPEVRIADELRPHLNKLGELIQEAQAMLDQHPLQTVLRQAQGTRFRIDQRLQAGAFAVGFAGVDTETDQKIILKLPAEKDPQGRDVWAAPELLAEASASLQREYEILQQIYTPLTQVSNSAYLVQPIAYGMVELPDLPPVSWMVQSFAPGQRLRDSKRSIIPMLGGSERVAINLLQQLTTMVLHLFTLNYRHGDLKPDALFWDASQQRLYVIDWNGAKATTTANDQAEEFDIVRNLVLEVLGGLSEARLNLQDLFFSPYAPDLSRGARLLLLRLSKDDAVCPNRFTTVAELDQALAQLKQLWDAADQGMPNRGANDPAARSEQLSHFSILLQNHAEDETIAPAIRDHQQLLTREASEYLRDWILRDWRGSYKKVLLEPALLLPDLIPLGIFGLFFDRWAQKYQRDRNIDQYLIPLVDALINKDPNTVDECIQKLDTYFDNSLRTLAKLLGMALRGHTNVVRADELVESNLAQARSALQDAALLKSNSYYRVVNQRIEGFVQHLAQRRELYEQMQKLQQQTPKTLKDQRQLCDLMQQLSASGLVTSAEMDAQQQIVSWLEQMDARMRTDDPRQLEQLWKDREELPRQARDLATTLATTYWGAIKDAIRRWLTTGPITQEATQRFQQPLGELRTFGISPVDTEAEAMQRQLANISACFMSLCNQTTTHPLNTDEYDDVCNDFVTILNTVAEQHTAINQLQQQAYADQALQQLLKNRQLPSNASDYSRALEPLQAVRQQLMSQTLRGWLSETPDAPTQQTILIELAKVDVVQACTWMLQVLQSQHSHLSGQMTAITDRVAALEARPVLTDRVAALEARPVLTDRVATLEQRADLTDRVATLETQIQDLKQAKTESDKTRPSLLARLFDSSKPKPAAAAEQESLPNTPSREEEGLPLGKWLPTLIGSVVLIAIIGLSLWLLPMFTGANPGVAVTHTGTATPGLSVSPSLVPTIPTPTETPTPVPVTINFPKEITPGKPYTLSSNSAIKSTEVILTLGDTKKTIPLTPSGSSASFTLPINFFTDLQLDRPLPIEDVKVEVQIGNGQTASTTASIISYQTTINTSGLEQLTNEETFSDGNQKGFYLWGTPNGQEKTPLSNGHIVLTAGDQVEILELKGDRYRVRVVTSAFDPEEAKGKEGWVRRVLVDGPGK